MMKMETVTAQKGGIFSCLDNSLREIPRSPRVWGRPCCVVCGRKERLIRQAERRAVSPCVMGWRQYLLNLPQGRRPQTVQALTCLSPR